MDKFIIGKTNFGIGKIIFNAHSKDFILTEISINGDKTIYKTLAET